MRVYEFAKLLNISNKELISILTDRGLEVTSHMMALPQEIIDSVTQEARQKKENSKQKIQPEDKVFVKQKPIEQVLPHEAEAFLKKNVLLIEPMTAGQFSQWAEKPISDVILSLLKQGIVSAKNQILTIDIVEKLAKLYELPVAYPSVDRKQEISVSAKPSEGIFRHPIVVVLGHVDHGKTTLLDFIRKTRLVSKEKGGITQHLGAYEARTDQGNLVFLDTPGHEAFSNIRGRGLRVADIAILVVAADDSIMPQTVEAIKKAQSAQVPIIVAINKIDKVDAARLDTVKRDLARYNLVVEDWGGQTICVPISAKTGQGVEKLLEMVILQAELMDLKADPEKSAQGFVLESKLEKGRGAVATVICQQGTLNIGDYFAAGQSYGKITAMMDSYGKIIKNIGPSIPVQVSGFSELPLAGDFFEVVNQEKYLKLKSVKSVNQTINQNALNNKMGAVNFIVKVDSSSTKEALVEALEKISEKSDKKIFLVYFGVGNVLESDVILAVNTQAIVLGLHVKIDHNVDSIAQKNMLQVKLYDVIYKLLEDVEVMLKEEEKPVYVQKKIGEAVVRKIFDIKNIGVIAGCYLKEGRFSREGKVFVFRGKKKVGEANIRGLERDRKSVKEVHAGFEFAFLADGFNEWEIDDRVECFLSVLQGK